MSVILGGIVVMVFVIWIVPAIPVNLLGAALIVYSVSSSRPYLPVW